MLAMTLHADRHKVHDRSGCLLLRSRCLFVVMRLQSVVFLLVRSNVRCYALASSNSKPAKCCVQHASTMKTDGPWGLETRRQNPQHLRTSHWRPIRDVGISSFRSRPGPGPGPPPGPGPYQGPAPGPARARPRAQPRPGPEPGPGPGLAEAKSGSIYQPRLVCTLTRIALF